MPVKVCPACTAQVGVRTLICPKCKYDFKNPKDVLPKVSDSKLDKTKSRARRKTFICGGESPIPFVDGSDDSVRKWVIQVYNLAPAEEQFMPHALYYWVLVAMQWRHERLPHLEALIFNTLKDEISQEDFSNR